MVEFEAAPKYLGGGFYLEVQLTEKTNTTPEKTITFTPIEGEEREIVMSYGLLDKLVSKVGDIDQVSRFFTDQEVRNAVLTEVISERSPTGKMTKKITPEDLALELETIDELLSWSAAHVTAFFIRSLTSLAKRINDLPQEDLKAGMDAALTVTSNGSRV